MNDAKSGENCHTFIHSHFFTGNLKHLKVSFQNDHDKNDPNSLTRIAGIKRIKVRTEFLILTV